MDGWNMSFLLGPGLFSGAFAVSLREISLLTWSPFCCGHSFHLSGEPTVSTNLRPILGSLKAPTWQRVMLGTSGSHWNSEKKMDHWDPFHSWLVGGFNYIFFYFHPYLGKFSNLTSIFFRWVETTNQPSIHGHFLWLIKLYMVVLWPINTVVVLWLIKGCFMAYKGWLLTTILGNPLTTFIFSC